jgi:hypothetical protein
MVCWNRSTLPWVWGWFGLPFFCLIPQAAQLGFQGVASAFAAGEPGSEDQAVAGEGGGRGPVAGGGVAEGGQHGRAGDPDAGGDRQGVPGVVIQPGQDLRVSAAGERVVGEVGLPAFVRHVGLEPDVGRLRALGRVGGNEALPGQGAADGGRRHLDPVMVFQVPGDGVRPGVQALTR